MTWLHRLCNSSCASRTVISLYHHPPLYNHPPRTQVDFEEDGSGDSGSECEEAPAPAQTPEQDGLGRWASFGADAEQAAARHGTAVAAELESAGLLRIESPGVYSFPMFTPAFCDLFLEELDNFGE